MFEDKEFPAEPISLPMLPLRDVVVFPHMVIPLFVGRSRSILALEAATQTNGNIFLAIQKNARKNEPSLEDLHSIGTIATILQLLKLPDGTVKVLVEGLQRAQISTLKSDGDYSDATVDPILSSEAQQMDHEVEALRRALLAQFDQYVKLNKRIPPEILSRLAEIKSTNSLADTIAGHLPLKMEQKQFALETIDIRKRLDHLLKQLEAELDILQVERRIRGRVKRQMEKTQREYYLNEQVKAIQKELGETDDHVDLDELGNKIRLAGMSKEARKKAESELRKLKMMSPMSAEATVVRGFIDTLLSLPWKKRTKIEISLPLAEATLNQDHYGLEKVKERILEYLAVQSRVDKLKAPILCLVGPPGVGKTSLGQSIARATGRKFVRMALGGVRDEAEIRGHRRTYIGSMPGKVLQSIIKIGVKNPLFLLDEVDKLGSDFRGDPSSALLEVLDPEQNHSFSDHYLDVEYDLSEVMFVATANTLNIPPALLDRMEVIRLSGYTEDEKINIALNYLTVNQMKANGLTEGELTISDTAIKDIIRYYTREAGVRSLDREIARICRKVVKSLLIKPSNKKIAITHKNLDKYLGVHRFEYGLAEQQNQVGQVTGLAWTEVGGELLTIEAVKLPGNGKMIQTGKLGDVMQESIHTALSVVRSRACQWGINPDFYQKHDIHIHLPEGATPKDGPSAGIGIATAMVSVLSSIPVRCDLAMTGEITLRGEVLPIGGLKEKLLAAHRGGIKQVLIPEGNVKDLAEIPDNVKRGVAIQPVKWFDQVLEFALAYQPAPWVENVSAISTLGEQSIVDSGQHSTKH